MSQSDFSVLGKVVKEPCKKLDVFPKPEGVETVVLESDEVTSVCPVTGQPDYETVVIEYAPDTLCIESKSLKLYFWSFRDKGVFCEALAARIANDVATACKLLIALMDTPLVYGLVYLITRKTAVIANTGPSITNEI